MPLRPTAIAFKRYALLSMPGLLHRYYDQIDIINNLPNHHFTLTRWGLKFGMCRGLANLWLSQYTPTAHPNAGLGFSVTMRLALGNNRINVDNAMSTIRNIHVQTNALFKTNTGIINEQTLTATNFSTATAVHNLAQFLRTQGLYHIHLDFIRGQHILAARTNFWGTTFYEPNGGIVSGVRGLHLFLQCYLRTPSVKSKYSGPVGPASLTAYRWT